MARSRVENDGVNQAGPSAKTPFPKLAQPAIRALTSAGYDHLEQLAGVPETSLARLHGMGPNALGKLRDALKDLGLSFVVTRTPGTP